MRILYDERAKATDRDFEVRARHILIASQELEVLAHMRIVEGADLAKSASELSIDSKTNGRGGDLGFFGLGRMVSEVEGVAFKRI